MNDLMGVILNGVAQLEYDRRQALPPQQELYLDKMDQKMDAGIQLGDDVITEPDLDQRAQFVAANLAHAILSDEEATAAALCSYLANRLPELKQVKIDNSQGDIAIELVFDEDYKKQVAVQLIH
jgi:hypothetical protein